MLALEQLQDGNVYTEKAELGLFKMAVLLLQPLSRSF